VGYDIHITRKAEWFDAEPKIGLEEWEMYASRDPLLSIEGSVGWKVGDKTVSAKVFVFRDPKNEKYPEAAVIAWQPFGDVVAKDPSTFGIAYMARIAYHLNARVQGDEGEFYDLQGNPI